MIQTRMMKLIAKTLEHDLRNLGKGQIPAAIIIDRTNDKTSATANANRLAMSGMQHTSYSERTNKATRA